MTDNRRVTQDAIYKQPGNISHREFFYLGIFGVAAIIGIAAYKQCIARDLGWYLTLGLGLSAALISTQLTGHLEVVSKLPSQPFVQAGGAIGVFVLIILFKPIIVPDGGPSQWVCPVTLPTGEGLPISDLPTNLRPASVAKLDPSVANDMPFSFVFDYQFGDLAGPRTWTQVRKGAWIEMYPSGKFFTAFEQQGTLTWNSCFGAVVERMDNTGMQVFIPNKSCANPILYFRTAKDPWKVLGKMYDIR